MFIKENQRVISISIESSFIAILILKRLKTIYIQSNNKELNR